MPINKDQKLFVNGKPAEPSKKGKLPLDVDWEAIIREKQKAAVKDDA